MNHMVEDMWKSGDVVLDADHFVGAEFTSNDGVEKQAEKTMDVLVVEPGQYPKMMTIGTNLEAMQKAVGGDIQAIYPYEEPVALVCDEEAKLTGKPLNRALRDEDGNIYDIVAGTFFICGLTEDDFGSLPKELQKKFEDKFKKPETFLKMGRSMHEVARALGVEPGELFRTRMEGRTYPEFYRITRDGLQFLTDAGKWEYDSEVLDLALFGVITIVPLSEEEKQHAEWLPDSKFGTDVMAGNTICSACGMGARGQPEICPPLRCNYEWR